MKPSLDHVHYRSLFTTPGQTACGLSTKIHKGIKISVMQPLVTCPVCTGEVKKEVDEAEAEGGGLTTAEKGELA